MHKIFILLIISVTNINSYNINKDKIQNYIIDKIKVKIILFQGQSGFWERRLVGETETGYIDSVKSDSLYINGKIFYKDFIYDIKSEKDEAKEEKLNENVMYGMLLIFGLAALTVYGIVNAAKK